MRQLSLNSCVCTCLAGAVIKVLSININLCKTHISECVTASYGKQEVCFLLAESRELHQAADVEGCWPSGHDASGAAAPH